MKQQCRASRQKLTIFAIAVAVSVSVLSSTTTLAADFPDRPITVIVPYNTGGGTDTTKRFLVNEAEKFFSQPVTVINRSALQAQW